MNEATYTIENQLDKILEILPRRRGDLFYVSEATWEEANPAYANVRNRDRKGHFGLVSTTLSAAVPVPINTHHGHSSCGRNEHWYHLRVQGLSRHEPDRDSFFDLLHTFPIPWRRFFRVRACARNLDKPCLSQQERQALDQAEHRILSRMQKHYEAVVAAYRQHPAWRERFPQLFGAQQP